MADLYYGSTKGVYRSNEFVEPDTQTEIESLKNIIKCKDDIIAAQDILIGQLRQHAIELRTSIENFAGKFKI